MKIYSKDLKHGEKKCITSPFLDCVCDYLGMDLNLRIKPQEKEGKK